MTLSNKTALEPQAYTEALAHIGEGSAERVRHKKLSSAEGSATKKARVEDPAWLKNFKRESLQSFISQQLAVTAVICRSKELLMDIEFNKKLLGDSKLAAAYYEELQNKLHTLTDAEQEATA